MSQKIKEFTNSTRDLLEPEFSRLRVQHEQEMLEARLSQEDDDRRSALDLENSFREKLSTEEKLSKDESRSRARSGLDSAILDAERLERDFKQRLQQCRMDSERELEEFQLVLSSRVARDRQVHVQGLEESNQSIAESIASQKKRHEDELKGLTKEHKSRVSIICHIIISVYCHPF